MRITRLILAGFLFLLPCGLVTVQAQNAPPIDIAARAGIHPDFDRIVFDWPRTVTYKLRRDGNQAVVTFSAAANTHFGSDFTHLTRAHGFSASTDAEGHLTVAFTVNAKSTLKDFTSEKSVVIDVQGATAPATNTAPAAAAAVPTPPAPETKTADTSTPPATDEPVSLIPAAPKPAPTPQAAPAKATANEAKAPAAAVVTPVTSQTLPGSTAPAKPASGTPTSAALSVLATEMSDTPLLVVSLDPHTPIRAAIFMRGGYGYIIFDRKLTLSLDALTAGQQAPRVTLEPLDLPKASGYRFAVPVQVDIHASRKDTDWQIFLSKQQADVPVSTALIPQPDFALGARYLLPLTDAPEPIRFTDPVVGDDLILVPLAQTEAFSVQRRLADFEIISAAQGLVIKPLIDKLIVRAVTDGIEITAEGGLHLSRAADTGASQQSSLKAKSAAAGKSIFDFALWRGKTDETFTQTRQRLQQTIVDVPDAERNRARLELARFYFANGYGEEASSLLAYLAKQVPDLMAHADFIAITGASKILSYRAEEGLKDLDSPLLNGQPEIELWQAVGLAELRSWPAAEEKFAITESILAGYPEPFYSRFSVLAIEAALAVDKDHEAADWIDRFESSPHQDSAAPAIAYLHGVLHAKAGRAAAAEQSWKEAEASDDRLYKIRAELALIDLGVANHSLTPAQAADRLEALRFGWRGDDLEVDILHRLGQFYIQAKNIKAGLGILAKATQLYPTSPLTPQIQEEMSGIFHDVFLGDLGKNLSALDALTLYQQYRNLMPPGADGIGVTKNLAERLVAIDLLDQAADLLEDLVKTKLKGEDKAHTGARLAAIRLLDHKPDAALTALDYDNGETLPPDLVSERTLLRAKALADLHRDEDALELLKDNNKPAAKLLRADITMHAQRWNEASKALLELVGEPPRAGVTLGHDQADWLVNCAIAMSLAGDQTGLDKLAVNYGAAMAGTPQNDTFRILTQPEKTVQMSDIADAQARIADVDMFQGFLNGYRKSDKVDPAAAAKAAQP
jgi:hypothetical protein